jgi:hypothetical protein
MFRTSPSNFPIPLVPSFRPLPLVLLYQLCPPELSGTYDIRNDLVGYQLAVLVPVLAILFPASFIVPHLPVEEQNDKKGEIEVSDWGVEAGR